MSDGVGKCRDRLAHEGNLLADVGPYAGGDDADFLDRGPPFRLRIEIVVEHLDVELVEQRRVGRLQIRDLDVALLALAQQVDDQRDARAVAVVDVGGVDDDPPAGGLGQRASGVAPDVADGRSVEPSRQRQDARVAGIRNRKRRHVSG